MSIRVHSQRCHEHVAFLQASASRQRRCVPVRWFHRVRHVVDGGHFGSLAGVVITSKFIECTLRRRDGMQSRVECKRLAEVLGLECGVPSFHEHTWLP